MLCHPSLGQLAMGQACPPHSFRKLAEVTHKLLMAILLLDTLRRDGICDDGNGLGGFAPSLISQSRFASVLILKEKHLEIFALVELKLQLVAKWEEQTSRSREETLILCGVDYQFCARIASHGWGL